LNIKFLPSIITLITDFGLQDEYVGVVKGVIFRHAPEARIVDISHLIPPQAIRTASHLLARSYMYFPTDTVHLVIVDPTVGSNRAILAIVADCQFFVGPDNGVFTPVLDNAKTLAIYLVNISGISENSVSSTFHGRDIMAPVAGRLAAGLEISELGPRITPEQCVRLDKVSCTRSFGILRGEIIHVDTFGNLCTNIRRQDIEDFFAGDEVIIQMNNDLIVPFAATYSDRTKGIALALCDSHNYLEIAINQENASQLLHLGLGAPIVLSRRQPRFRSMKRLRLFPSDSQ
jgi:S-adenosyl-L-methionine hydrolase (adenosine-forming)